MASTRENPFRLNVGFIVHQPVGYSRDFLFEFASIQLSPDLILEDFKARAHISRTQIGLLVQIDAQGTTAVECVRCLTVFQQPLNTYFTELFAFTPQAVSEEVPMVLPETGYLDLGPLLREYLIIEIPISPLCRPDCKGLCPICGENRNEHDCQHEASDIDPRLAGLQYLLSD